MGEGSLLPIIRGLPSGGSRVGGGSSVGGDGVGLGVGGSGVGGEGLAVSYPDSGLGGGDGTSLISSGQSEHSRQSGGSYQRGVCVCVCVCLCVSLCVSVDIQK